MIVKTAHLFPIEDKTEFSMTDTSVILVSEQMVSKRPTAKYADMYM